MQMSDGSGTSYTASLLTTRRAAALTAKPVLPTATCMCGQARGGAGDAQRGAVSVCLCVDCDSLKTPPRSQHHQSSAHASLALLTEPPEALPLNAALVREGSQ